MQDDLDELTRNAPYKRSAEELSTEYKQFFQEHHEFDVSHMYAPHVQYGQPVTTLGKATAFMKLVVLPMMLQLILEEEPPLPPHTEPQIVIPTGKYSDCTAPTHTLSSETLQSVHARRMASRHSAPAVGATDEELVQALRELRLPQYPSELDLYYERNAYRPTGSRTRVPYHESCGSTSDGSTPSAINVKTGSSVFALDLSPRASRKPVRSRSPGSKPKKKPGKNRSTRKSKGKAKEEVLPPILVPSLSITPLMPMADDNSDEENDMEEEFVPVHHLENPEVYADIAVNTKSIGRFNKIAFPEMFGHLPPPNKEPLYEKRLGMQRNKIFEDIDRYINPEHVVDKVVYDLDALVRTAGATYTSNFSNHTNIDELT